MFSKIPIELKCLQVILNDETKSKALEDDCREKLQQRIEMFNNAAAVSYLLVKHFLPHVASYDNLFHFFDIHR